MKKRKIAALSIAAIAMGTSMSLAACSGGKTLVGFDIDLCRSVVDKLGVAVQFQEIVWEQKEIELNAKNIDLIWNGMTITDERKEAMSFSVPYMVNKQVIVAKKSFVSAIEADSSYHVAVEAGSAGSDVFDQNDIFGKSLKVETTDQITALTEVLSGTSDLAIIDSVMAGYYLADSSSYGSSLKILSDYSFASESYGIGARKGEDALLAKVNEAMQMVYNAGTTAQIAAKYGLSEDIVAPADFASYASLSDTSSWDYVQSKGRIVVGYTIFAPIAFEG